VNESWKPGSHPGRRSLQLNLPVTTSGRLRNAAAVSESWGQDPSIRAYQKLASQEEQKRRITYMQLISPGGHIACRCTSKLQGKSGKQLLNCLRLSIQRGEETGRQLAVLLSSVVSSCKVTLQVKDSRIMPSSIHSSLTRSFASPRPNCQSASRHLGDRFSRHSFVKGRVLNRRVLDNHSHVRSTVPTNISYGGWSSPFNHEPGVCGYCGKRAHKPPSQNGELRSSLQSSFPNSDTL
jgi:hypothetical protein